MEVDGDGKVMPQATHDQFERYCLREKQALKNQVILVIAKFDSPCVRLSHAAVKRGQSGQFHNEVTFSKLHIGTCKWALVSKASSKRLMTCLSSSDKRGCESVKRGVAAV